MKFNFNVFFLPRESSKFLAFLLWAPEADVAIDLHSVQVVVPPQTTNTYTFEVAPNMYCPRLIDQNNWTQYGWAPSDIQFKIKQDYTTITIQRLNSDVGWSHYIVFDCFYGYQLDCVDKNSDGILEWYVIDFFFQNKCDGKEAYCLLSLIFSVFIKLIFYQFLKL